MLNKLSKETVLRHATIYTSFVLVIWGFYRLMFKLPEEIEEVILKPIIWLVPLVFLLKKEQLGLGSLGITLKNFFPAVYFSIGLGAIFAIEGVLINFIKYGSFNFQANVGQSAIFISLGLSFITAISEEVSFRGYIFNRLWWVLKNEWLANILTSVAWGIVHVPVTVFVWKLNPSATITYLLLTVIFGVGSAFVFARTKNVFSSIFLHVLWAWPIVLFR